MDEQANTHSHNLSILVHKVDGRLLLTGPSGIYNDLIAKKLQFYQGRFLLVLLSDSEETDDALGLETAKKDELPQDLYDAELIQTVSESDSGLQILVKSLAENFKLLQINRAFNLAQLELLTRTIETSLKPFVDDS